MSISNYAPIILTSDSPVPLIPSLLTNPILPVLPTINRYPTVPIITTINPLVTFPLHPSLDLNRDSKLQQMMTKYFYYKTLDKWLKREKDMLNILNYLKITDRGVELINNINDYKSNNTDKDTQNNIDKKVDYIEKNIFSKDDMHNILKKYVKETTTNWYDLEDKATFFIKEIIKNFIKNKLKEAIQLKSNQQY